MGRRSIANDREVIHIRLPRETVQAIDALASYWLLSRTETVERLLHIGIGNCSTDLVALARTLLERFDVPSSA